MAWPVPVQPEVVQDPVQRVATKDPVVVDDVEPGAVQVLDVGEELDDAGGVLDDEGGVLDDEGHQ